MYSKDYYESADYNPEVIGIDIFKKISQYTPYMVFITKAPDFKLLYANRKVSQFLGLDLNDLREMDGRIVDMMDDGEIVKILEAGQKINLIDDDQAVKLQVKLKTKDGRAVYLEASVSVFKRNNDHTPAEYFCVAENITEKVLLEERTLELEMITNTAEEAFRYGAWEWFPDEDGIIWSNGIYDIFEVDAGTFDLNIDRYLEMIHPDDIDQFNRCIDDALDNSSPFLVEYRIISANNNIYYLREQGKPLLDDNGRIVKFIGTIRDVSDYWETLNNLRKYEITLQQAEKNLQLGAWEWDITNSKVKWSDGFWNILQYPQELHSDQWMPLEHYFSHLPPGKGSIASAMVFDFENYDGTTTLEPREIMLNTYEGNSVYVVTHTRILEWKDGKPSLAVGSTADVTQMKNVQKNLEDKITELAKAYDEVERFSYVASHDLQEPLRKITSFSERLKQKCGDGIPADCIIYLDRIQDGANRMRILIENLLSLSRTKRNADYFKPTDLNEIIAEVVTDLENTIAEKSAVVQYEALPVIDAISTQMHQLFLNLLSNSLKFTRKDAPTVIHIIQEHVTEKQKNDYNLDTQLDYVHIRVQDNGIGFDSDFAEAIFNPFKRLHGRSEYEGTGIGLAICKKVAQNHLGIIWAESVPDDGATFHIILAIKQPGDQRPPVQ